MPGKEQPPENREPQSAAYLRTVRFAAERPAWRAYAQIQRTVLTSASDLSCFRLQLNGVWHVAVLGAIPSTEVLEHIDSLLSDGAPARLPDDVIQYLQARRAEAVALGTPWIELHYRP